VIILKKTKLKLKKRVWVLFVIVLFLAIALYAGNKIHKNNLYKDTTEYKLLQVGYSLDEIDFLQKNLEKDIIEALYNTPKNEFLIELLNEKYYLKKNLARYLTYYKEHSDYSAKQIVTIVNTNTDYAFYDYNIETDISKDFVLIVNKYYHLNEDYVPTDLVNVNNKYYYGSNHRVRKVLYDAFIDMWNQAYNEGIYLIINSSYRDYQSQAEVYDDYKNSQGTTYADSIAARPGYSEHQTGLSIDIFSKENTTTSNFKNSTAHIWLINNAHKYGFIQRYQEGKENITGFKEESWHWRYVGVEAASYIHDSNITFDEYYAYFIEK